MTEKRFTIDDGTIRDNYTAIVYYCLNVSGRELCDKLNWQHERITELEKQILELEKENNNEREFSKALKEVVGEQDERILELEKENQRLNLTIKGLLYVLQHVKQIDVDIDLSDLEIGDD